MTKDETLAFLNYLRGKDKILIESQFHAIQTFFLERRVEDTYPISKHLADVIQNASSAMDAYRAVAHETAKMNSDWRTKPDLAYSYYEDLVESNLLPPNWTCQHRTVFEEFFPTEYLLFRYENYSDASAFQTTRIPCAANWWGFRHTIKSAEAIVEPARITLVYDSKENPLDEKKLESAANFLCTVMNQDRIYVKDLQESDMTLIQNRTKKAD